MTNAREFKAVDLTVPQPFDHFTVNVCPVSVFGRPGTVGHSVGIMNEEIGQGRRMSIELAEAEANAVLKAIRAYRRKNRALLAEKPDGSE